MEIDVKGSGRICAKRCAEYRRSGKKRKGEILDEIISSAGGNKDYWATKLRNWGRAVYAEAGGRPVKYVAKDRPPGEKHAGGRPKTYGPDLVKTLTMIWEDFGFRTGKRLIPDIRGMIKYLSREKEYGINKKIKEQLLKISPAQADRLLAPARRRMEGPLGISTTKPAKLNLRSQVPVCTHMERSEARPGQFCADTVAHCGGSASGQFCKSLTYRDLYSGWLEERALLNAAKRWVEEASEDIKRSLPFPLLSVHDDDGGEFINVDFIAWCAAGGIMQTRSRPNHKNDNPLAEQTNYDAVRKRVGYYRYDTREEWEALVEVYKYFCPLYNYWFHSAKLIGRVQVEGGRMKKVYEKEAKTPYDRLMESPDLSEECKAELKRRKAEQNPVLLMKKFNEAVGRLLKINSKKDKMKQTVSEKN